MRGGKISEEGRGKRTPDDSAVSDSLVMRHDSVGVLVYPPLPIVEPASENFIGHQIPRLRVR